MFATSHPSLQSALLPNQGTAGVLKNILLVVLGSLALWASAKMKVDIGPVPLTMQTLVLMVIAMSYGWKLAGATVLLYLLEGAAGLPVFAGTPEKGLGLVYMTGTTGGYLVGFLVAAVSVGWLAERGFDRNIFTAAIAMLVGSALIYIFGAAYLSSFIGFAKAWQFGVLPFLAGDAIKVAIAALFMPTVWAVIKRF